MRRVYAGKLLDEQLLVAGALYTLTNLGRATDLTYGGLLVGWMTAPEHRIRFGARSLVGFGEGEVPVTIQGYPVNYSAAAFEPRDLVRFGGGRLPQPVPLPTTSFTVRVRDNFAVLEPQGSISARVTSHIAVEFAAGYRVTGFSDALRDRLNGVTGALALQLGW